MTVKALIFDMDGLMFDSESIYCVAFIRAAQDIGMHFTEQDFITLVGKSEEQTERLLRDLYAQSHKQSTDPTLSPDYPHDIFVEAWLSHWRSLIDEQPVPLKSGLLQLLDWAGRHALPCAIATSSGREQMNAYLGQAQLADRFAFTVTREDVDNGKPAPDPYLRAAQGLGIAPHHCVAFEDSNTGCASAVAAGIRVIVVPDLVDADGVTHQTASAVVTSLGIAHQHVMTWHGAVDVTDKTD